MVWEVLFGSGRNDHQSLNVSSEEAKTGGRWGTVRHKIKRWNKRHGNVQAFSIVIRYKRHNSSVAWIMVQAERCFVSCPNPRAGAAPWS